MSTETLLIEIGTEELPPQSLKKLATTFYEQIAQQLNEAELCYEEIEWFATPRRMAVKVSCLVAQQENKAIQKRGPATNVAFDEAGNPSRAALGWAKSNGITIEQAQRLTTDKGEWLLHEAVQQGQTVEQLLPGMVNVALSKLPISKPMRWGSSRIQFIRPVHTLTLMYGEKVIACKALGVCSNNKLLGHRFHHQGLITLKHAEDYESSLKKAHVIADYNLRQQLISDQIAQAAKSIDGNALIDQELLDEVTALVEWPITLVGCFEQSFLKVPAEPLIYSMKDHQKYFPVTDKQGKLLNKFIFVTNIESKAPDKIIQGNEKVIRPRLADAEFFFKKDKQQTLENRLDGLETVLFQKQLGTLKEKSHRIAKLSQYIAVQLQQNSEQAFRAGLLSKTDLLSDMVLEFPQVQGTMGKYYAQHDGEEVEVAQALEDQYRPRYAGDSLPHGVIGCAVAIADKIDTLVGIFGIDQPPKGDKDPFALRRAAIGIIRIVIERELLLDIDDLVKQSIDSYGNKLSNKNTQDQVLEFVLGRFKAFYKEKNIAVDVIQAVLTNKPSAPLDFNERIKAVAHFKALPASATLTAANKRVGNILAKFNGQLYSCFDPDLACEKAEKNLAEMFSTIKQRVKPLTDDKNYRAALVELAELKQAIDEFFDDVMVMAEDEKVKINRLTLLNDIRNSFLAIADISLLQQT